MSEELAGQTVASLQLGVPFMVTLYVIIGIIIAAQIIVVTFQK
ncbi:MULTISPECIES: hypothetical protein [Ectothiorhodospira]|nr:MULTISPECIES: hypothetical protein [Ectothiorhodospira]